MAVLCLVTAWVFWEDLALGQSYYGSDTLSFYYPLMAWYAQQLKSGQIPLWVPYIFGGYPLFADGEVGMLYPLNLAAFALLPADTAFIWLRPVHFLIAAQSCYWLGRLLGLTRFGALLAALTFSYGSFLVSHLQHENILRSTVWLPLALGYMELALRARGRRRLSWLLACGLVVGVQMLGVHVQPVLLTLLALACWAVVGPLGPGQWRAQPRALLGAGGRGVGRRFWLAALRFGFSRALCLAVVAIVALALAAVQLIPLYQLGERSMRGGGVSYDFSSSYSVPPTQLIQLVLPYLFRPEQAAYWGLWSATETTLYLGVAPFLLALVAVAYSRSWTVGWLGVGALAGLLLALGDYLPLKLYGIIWSLPGFSYLRVPARFGLFVVLAGGLLAGFGADWLAGRVFDRRPAHRPRLRVRRLVGLAAGFSAAALGLAFTFVVIRGLIELAPNAARQAIESYYLSLRRGELSLSASAVYFSLLRSLDLANPRTQVGLLLMLLASLWLLLRGLHLLPLRPWRSGLLLLVVLDLGYFARGFNPHLPIEALRLTLPPVQFLAERNGLHRVFVEPALYGLLGPNRLIGPALDLAGGYSSLEPRRATEYWWSIVRQDTVLLDLYNVRYVVAPRLPSGLSSFDGALFHPADRLLRAAPGNPSGSEVFELEPWWTESVTVIAATEGWRGLGVGEPLAEITLRGNGEERHLTLRFGADVDDGTAPLQGPTLPGARLGPRIAWRGPSFQSHGQAGFLYAATIKLDQPLMVSQVQFERVGSPGALNLHGIGLHDRPGLPVRSITPADRAKYQLVYQDQDVRVFENADALPRAFMVGAARAAGARESVVEQMVLGPIDPRTTIILDADQGAWAGGEPNPIGSGSVQIAEYEPNRVLIRVQTDQPGYLVLLDRYDENWVAKVDARTVPLLRANAMFRAVPTPAGRHEVVFTYEPWSVRLGAAVSLVAVLVVLVAGLWSVWSVAGRKSVTRRPPQAVGRLSYRPRS